MNLLHDVSYFFGGAVLTNVVPHFVAAIMGEPFQTPFAKPSGKGLSSSKVNMLWAVFNLVVAYFLILRVGDFNLRDPENAIAFGLGVLLFGLLMSHQFGKLHGGNMPLEVQKERQR